MFDVLDWSPAEGLGSPTVYLSWIATECHSRVKDGLAGLYMQLHRVIARDDALSIANSMLFAAAKVTALYARSRVYYGIHPEMAWAYPKVFRYV
jgi:hypothetical protein